LIFLCGFVGCVGHQDSKAKATTIDEYFQALVFKQATICKVARLQGKNEQACNLHKFWKKNLLAPRSFFISSFNQNNLKKIKIEPLDVVVICVFKF
jgi:glycerophosphoryl diester phosphodiesterase